jgi:diguanylate cyclase (GGDEF)-like protein
LSAKVAVSNTPTADIAVRGGSGERLARASSVKGLVIGGFGLLVALLACVGIGASWQVKAHESDLAELEHHSTVASLLQNVEAQAATSGLLLQRYVDAGNGEYVQEIQDHADAAQASLQAAMEQDGSPELVSLTTTGAQLVGDAARATQLRQSGDIPAASAVLEQIVPTFREYRLQLEAMSTKELTQVSQLREDADTTGQRAFWLLVISTVVGVVVGIIASVFIARTIIRPLAALEATARRAFVGDLSARAPVTGPAEFAHLGFVLNDMMGAIESRTTDLRKANDELVKKNRDLVHARSQAATDPLTGLGNHRSFHKRVREEIGKSDGQRRIGLIMIDVDGFKDVNDSLGHLAGDQLLRDMAETLTSITPREDTFRYGGDEFAVITPGCGEDEAAEIARKLRSAVAAMAGFSMTISLGVAAYPADAETAQDLVYRADMAMYMAKSSGKNRVEVWSGLKDRGMGEVTPSARR